MTYAINTNTKKATMKEYERGEAKWASKQAENEQKQKNNERKGVRARAETRPIDVQTE